MVADRITPVTEDITVCDVAAHAPARQSLGWVIVYPDGREQTDSRRAQVRLQLAD